MCESGRKLSDESSGVISSRSMTADTFDAMFPCVSIAPFGSPVVPDV